VLADAGFGTVEFLRKVRELGYQAVVGMRCDRRLQDGRQLSDLRTRGEQVALRGLSFPVFVSWVWLKRQGQREQRFAVSTRALSGTHIARWGKRRWQIEGFFKTAKHRFGLHRFGQGTRQGVYRWIVLSFLAFILAYWAHLTAPTATVLDWGAAARAALEGLLAGVVLLDLLLHIKHLYPLTRSHGIDIRVTRCKI
jgi:Transposase DDE domain